jgi:hypothetical protein
MTHASLCGLIVTSCFIAGSGAASADPPDSAPGLQLTSRVEAHLARKREALEEWISHYGLVFPVEQTVLLAAMEPVRVYGEVDALVVGTENGFEPHGGGVLALLLAHWRPDGRACTLDDGFYFAGNHARIPLRALYASHKRQLYLPEPSRVSSEIAGAVPDAPQLPRMRLSVGGAGVAVDVDSYHQLLMLAEHEADPSAAWTNAQGQQLSSALVLEHARSHYLSTGDTPAEPEDHSNLHLVEVLLAASRRLGSDPEAIRQRFLSVELQRESFDPDDASLLLAHYAESLGLLVADPRFQWSLEERQKVNRWLGWLESQHFRDLDAEDPRHLAHLLRGLRLIRSHQTRIAATPAEPP